VYASKQEKIKKIVKVLDIVEKKADLVVDKLDNRIKDKEISSRLREKQKEIEEYIEDTKKEI
jgi:hypothetical protein